MKIKFLYTCIERKNGIDTNIKFKKNCLSYKEGVCQLKDTLLLITFVVKSHVIFCFVFQKE